ncbi:MAG: molybdenum cofactor guanylyltransferase [Thermodesulfovibrionales bacterium]|nr:molybdenum cofactor guanylyltransferase [Thermodesulfovibrionales bacterium]
MDAVILAGGENTRMPFLKGFLEFGGRKIITSNVALLRGIFRRTFIVTNDPARYFSLDAHLVGDVTKGKGPLGGILSALTLPDVSEVFVTACDMPFINVILIQYMTSKWDGKGDVLIPLYKGRSQPLFGIYSKKTVKIIEEYITSGRRSVREFLQNIQATYISQEEVMTIDPEGRSFVNINTMEDSTREGGRVCLG